MSSSSECIAGKSIAKPGVRPTPIFANSAIKTHERTLIEALGKHTLVERAGLAIARFAMAIAPHSRRIWIPCGPGNNGADGMACALHLQAMGKTPIVTLLAEPSSNSPWAEGAYFREKCSEAGVNFQAEIPEEFDACIDALFGIGSLRTFDDKCLGWIQAINQSGKPVIAVDVPTGLQAENGSAASHFVKASHTLTMVAAKPGLFMFNGRDACGEIWINTLGVLPPANPCAELNFSETSAQRLHCSHKGTFGDVGIIGGDAAMSGASLLSATAALYGGAGRVLVGLLEDSGQRASAWRPEFIGRSPAEMPLEEMTIVAGCGGGQIIATILDDVIQRAHRLVLDADALNALSNSPSFAELITKRPGDTTVMTPHPLEAARLLGMSTQDIQGNRIKAAQAIARKFACTVVLKGSGSVIANAADVPRINITGDSRLATAGTGDVLAGLTGAYLASGAGAFASARKATYFHGLAVEKFVGQNVVTARDLAESLSHNFRSVS
jgi:hydroxyethylthiazole kinase-like uncharacterized protein yjeF